MSMGVEHQHQYSCQCVRSSAPNSDCEVKAGTLFMLRHKDGVTVKVPVFVRVYRNFFEHYAVVCCDSTVRNNSLYVSLKSCVVMTDDKCPKDIMVIPDNAEGGVVTFQTLYSDDVADWISVLQSTQSIQCIRRRSNPLVMPKSPLMPMLQELNEESEV